MPDQWRSVAMLLVLMSNAFMAALVTNQDCLAKAPTVRSSNTYAEYGNEKYRFSVEYPTFLKPQSEPDAHDGRTFLSGRSALQMRAWGTYRNWPGEDSTISEQMQWTLSNLESKDLPQPKTTYKAKGKNFFVISGVSQENIFYQRTIVVGDAFATVWLLYPTKFKNKFAPLVEHIAGTLKGL